LVAGEPFDLRRVVRGNHEEELERHATLLALRQHQAGREATVRLGHVERELVVTGERLHDLLVQLEVRGAVLDEPAEVLRVARDHVVAGHQVDQEVVELEEVLPVGVDAVRVTVLVVLRSEEHGHDRLLRLVRDDVQLERERQVVEAGHARVQHKVLALVVGHLAELLHLARLHRALVEHLHVDGVRDVRVEVVEVRHQLVHLDRAELHAREVDLVVLVARQRVLEAVVEADDALEELVEQRVAHGRLVALEHARNRAELVVHLERAAEEELGHLLEVAVEALVHAVTVRLDEVAEVLDSARRGNVHERAVGQDDEAVVDRLHQASLVVGDLLHDLVLLGVRVVVVLADRERNAVVVAQGWIVPGGDRLVPREGGDRAEVVRQALQVVAGQELLVLVQVELAAAILVQAVLLAAHPRGVVGVEVVVVRVQANVLHEVADALLRVAVHVVAGVVARHVRTVHTVRLLHAVEALHLVALRLADHHVVEEVERIDLVRGRQDDALHVRTVQHRHGDGVHEHTLVDVEAGPHHRLVERVPVLGVVE
uniref:Uncharacterized protein n=1 Tax=Anopheles atroparvus TaxID=41427 RepID=A0AAG5CS64_ANOAO